MTLFELRETFRIELRRRIAAGLITQTQLSTDSHVRQATISKFVHGAKISWDSAAAMMLTLDISVEYLVELRLASINARKQRFVPLVKQVTAAITPVLAANHIVQWTDTPVASLESLPVKVTDDRASWTRFVAIDATEDQIAFMRPSLRPGARLIIDRHYQEAAAKFEGGLAMYDGRFAIYLVAGEAPLRIGHLQVLGSNLALHRLSTGNQKIDRGDIVGRVCEMIARNRI